MDHLKFTKTRNKFMERFHYVSGMRSYGQMMETAAIQMARESILPEQAKSVFDPRFETAYINEHGEPRVIVAGTRGHLIFGADGALYVSMEYHKTSVFLNHPAMVIELIEHAFYGGHALAGITEMLDNQLYTPNQAFADIRWFMYRHSQLVQMQQWSVNADR